ncbi:MAG: toxin-antitoxin system HicB family antitoxin [Acidobacteriota bacterium]
MATITVRLPDEKHERLKLMAKRQGISLNKLFEELSTTALAEFDVETRFRVRAQRGSVEKGLAILDSLDSAEEGTR